MSTPIETILSEIEARSKAALAPEWKAELNGKRHRFWTVWNNATNDRICLLGSNTEDQESLAVFIASARTDVPSLVAEVRRLRAICATASTLIWKDNPKEAVKFLSDATDPEKSALK